LIVSIKCGWPDGKRKISLILDAFEGISTANGGHSLVPDFLNAKFIVKRLKDLILAIRQTDKILNMPKPLKILNDKKLVEKVVRAVQKVGRPRKAYDVVRQTLDEINLNDNIDEINERRGYLLTWDQLAIECGPLVDLDKLKIVVDALIDAYYQPEKFSTNPVLFLVFIILSLKYGQLDYFGRYFERYSV
jgi:hypothetical protein